MSDYFTGCEVCETNARTYGVMTAECKVDELEAQVATLKARIAQLEAAAQWRPMATAPRDGTLILVSGRGPDGEDCEVIEWTDEAQLVLEEELSGCPEVAIAWLPIPALPEGGV